MRRVHTLGWRRTRRYDEPSNDLGPLSPHQSCPAYIIDTRGYDSREGQEGLTLRVANVKRSMEFYGDKLGLRVEIDKAPQFAMIRVGGPTGGTIGLLAHDNANPLGSISMTPEQRAGIHVEDNG